LASLSQRPTNLKFAPASVVLGRSCNLLRDSHRALLQYDTFAMLYFGTCPRWLFAPWAGVSGIGASSWSFPGKAGA
jgi:hypothetical protein